MVVANTKNPKILKLVVPFLSLRDNISSEHKRFLSSYLLRIDCIIQKPIFLPGCDYFNNCFYNYKKFFQM